MIQTYICSRCCHCVGVRAAPPSRTSPVSLTSSSHQCPPHISVLLTSGSSSQLGSLTTFSSLPQHNFGKVKKEKVTLAIIACLCSRHILWQYFDSYLLEVRKKRKVKGRRGEGGLKKRSCQKGIPESLSSGGGLRRRVPPLALFRGHSRPGASVQLALRLPGSSWSPPGYSSPSSAALWRSGGGLGCWRRPGERRRRRKRSKLHLVRLREFATEEKPAVIASLRRVERVSVLCAIRAAVCGPTLFERKKFSDVEKVFVSSRQLA